jgi:hypothetical protein
LGDLARDADIRAAHILERKLFPVASIDTLDGSGRAAMAIRPIGSSGPTSSDDGPGTLVRIQKHQSDAKPVAYIVALSDAARALDLVRKRFADPDDRLDDLGQVSNALIKALGLQRGDIVRAEARFPQDAAGGVMLQQI